MLQVHELLSSSIDSRSILAIGKEKEGLLNESNRRQLGKLVISKLLSTDETLRIPSTVFSRLALQIEKIFPKESPSLYFSPSGTKKGPINQSDETLKKKNASGLLYEAYVGRRRRLRKIGFLNKRVATNLFSEQSTSSATVQEDSEPTAGKSVKYDVLLLTIYFSMPIIK